MYMRVEVGFPGCEKAVEAGGDAIWLWAAMKAYCKVNETDGRVPACMIGRLQGPDPSQQKRLVRRLVNAKLVDEVDGDFWLHDYLDWEESAEQAKSRRSAQRQRKAEWERRERERKERERNGVTGDHSNAVTNGIRNGSSEGKGSVVEGSGGKLPTEETPGMVSGSGQLTLEPVQPPEPEPVRVVFNRWRTAIWSQASKREPKFSPERTRIIKARLKSFSVDDLCQAIDRAAKSDFHVRSKNANGTFYGDFDNLIGSDGKVERWLVSGEPTPDQRTEPYTRRGPTGLEDTEQW